MAYSAFCVDVCLYVLLSPNKTTSLIHNFKNHLKWEMAPYSKFRLYFYLQWKNFKK